ncbi:Protein O-mannosyltransferase 2 [Coemansia sp. RSA 1972]|nr:Protein O-mannosyltransferase 2 [Coemansia sp. RSA 1972]
MYLNRTFIRDIHPPLGKLLVALSEHMAGHNGTFDFPNGSKYPEWVNHTQMRIQLCVFGILMAPLAYVTCRRLCVSRGASILAALFVVLDNALCLMTRIITLDAVLLGMTALLVFCAVSARSSRVGSKAWQLWTLSTGVALGLTISVKWAGAFTVALVGVYAAVGTLNDISTCVQWRQVVQRLAIRALLLICVPLCVYACVFRVHFALQTRQGYGEHKMPIRWQAQLPGNRYNRQPGSIAYGAAIKLWADRVTPIGAALLQSPIRNGAQMVDCSYVVTGADWWSFRRSSQIDAVFTNMTVEYVQNGDVVVVRNDLSHKVLAVDTDVVAVDKVSSGVLWVVEIAENDVALIGTADDRNTHLVHPIQTALRLRHKQSGCVLSTTYSTSGSTRVECISQNHVRRHNDWWRIQFNVDLRLGFDNNLQGKVRWTFLEALIGQNMEMARTNSELVLSDPDKYDATVSRPWEWPFLINPMRMSVWDVNIELNARMVTVYEIGNPLLWWMSAICCTLVFPIRFIVQLCQIQRCGYGSLGTRTYNALLLWIGWFMHYAPYFAMRRVVYSHHFMPALYFGLLLLAHELDVLGSCMPRLRRTLALLVLIMVATVFWMFRACTYGWEQRSFDDLAHLRWINAWDIAANAHDYQASVFASE